jgi:uncharacterized membrane protein YeaQ/YmgE (transglycosylase-associated protein family)
LLARETRALRAKAFTAGKSQWESLRIGYCANDSRVNLSGGWSMDQRATTIIWLAVGAIVAWLAAKVLKRTGFGLVGDIIAGMIGGLAGGFIWSSVHSADGFDLYGTVASPAVGAVILLVLWRVARR